MEWNRHLRRDRARCAARCRRGTDGRAGRHRSSHHRHRGCGLALGLFASAGGRHPGPTPALWAGALAHPALWPMPRAGLGWFRRDRGVYQPILRQPALAECDLRADGVRRLFRGCPPDLRANRRSVRRFSGGPGLTLDRIRRIVSYFLGHHPGSRPGGHGPERRWLRAGVSLVGRGSDSGRARPEPGHRARRLCRLLRPRARRNRTRHGRAGCRLGLLGGFFCRQCRGGNRRVFDLVPVVADPNRVEARVRFIGRCGDLSRDRVRTKQRLVKLDRRSKFNHSTGRPKPALLL